MEFSLLTLTLGSFLIFFPYLSEAVTVDITMKDYSPMNTELEINCKFQDSKQVLKVTLLHGDSKTIAVYDLEAATYKIDSNKITLKIGPNTSAKGGLLTFVIKRVLCSDFTSYVCEAEGGLNSEIIRSDNKTLKVFPNIDDVTTDSVPTVHQMSTFMCRGTVSKTGNLNVKWYRRVISADDQIQTATLKIPSQTQCHRNFESSLTYNISEADRPTLILWCQVDVAQTVQKMGNFTVQEISTVAAPIKPQAVKAGLDAGRIVGIVLGITAVIVLIVLLVWFLVIRPKRLKADGPSKDQCPEPNAKDYQVQDNVLYATVDPLKKEDMKGQVNPALEDKQDGDNAPYTVYPSSKYEVAPGEGYENPAMDQDVSNHMSGSTV